MLCRASLSCYSLSVFSDGPVCFGQHNILPKSFGNRFWGLSRNLLICFLVCFLFYPNLIQKIGKNHTEIFFIPTVKRAFITFFISSSPTKKRHPAVPTLPDTGTKTPVKQTYTIYNQHSLSAQLNYHQKVLSATQDRWPAL